MGDCCGDSSRKYCASVDPTDPEDCVLGLRHNGALQAIGGACYTRNTTVYSVDIAAV